MVSVDDVVDILPRTHVTRDNLLCSTYAAAAMVLLATIADKGRAKKLGAGLFCPGETLLLHFHMLSNLA